MDHYFIMGETNQVIASIKKNVYQSSSKTITHDANTGHCFLNTMPKICDDLFTCTLSHMR